MKPYKLFKHQLMLIANSALVVCATIGSAVVTTTSLVQPNQTPVFGGSSDAMCWHNGMGPADLCDPFFAPSAHKFSHLNH
jgi:hypothetical protein